MTVNSKKMADVDKGSACNGTDKQKEKSSSPVNVASNSTGKPTNVATENSSINQVKDIRVVNLTKKIFASFPIKHEPSEAGDAGSSKLQESSDETLLYVSDEGMLYHAMELKGNAEDIDKKSLFTENGVIYFIRQIQDEELNDLIIEYLELIKVCPEGVFTIDKSGNYLKKSIKKEKTPEAVASKQPGPPSKPEEVITIMPIQNKGQNQSVCVVKNEEDGNMYAFQDDDFGDEVVPVKNIASQRKQDLKQLYTDRRPQNLSASQQRRGGRGKTSQGGTDDHNKMTMAKGRKKRQGRLIFDNKTEFPIFEMKMNMQVTHDIINQTSQVASEPKKVKSIDALMQSPGRNLLSDKLLEMYNKNLHTSTAIDPDGLEDMELGKVDAPGPVYIRNEEEPDPGGQWKICYI